MSRTKQTKTYRRGTVHITLPRLHAGQWQVVREAGRFNALACGRRWGKSTLGIDRLIHPALDGAPVAYFVPTYKMLAEVWRTVSSTVRLLALRNDRSAHRIELMTGGVVEMWSLEHPDTVRGRKYRRVVIDEAAMVRDLGRVWQQIVRPTLADLRGDAWLLSTPRGRNFFWECFRRGEEAATHGAHGVEWRSWQMPTWTNPHIHSAEVEAARHDLPERVFAQEFEARFLEEAGGVFRRVQEAVSAEWQEAAVSGHDYVMGCDWGRQADYTVLAVLDVTERALVHLDRFNRVDYALQLERLRALAERFAPRVIVAEQNSIGLPLVEQMQRTGLPVQPFVTSNRSKMEIIDGLALALERGDLRLVNDPVLLDELLAYEMERLPSGLARYSAPAGRHDDTVMALALAWSAVGEAGPLVLW